MDSEVLGDLGDRGLLVAVQGDADDVVAELFRVGLWHGVYPSRLACEQARSDVTKPCISPFKTKRDATLWMNSVEVSKSEGNYVDPTAGKVTIRELGESWISRQVHWEPSYRRSMESSWNTHVLPKWGNWPVASITRSELQSWIAGIGKSRSTA